MAYISHYEKSLHPSKRIPAVCFSSGEHKDLHTPADDPEKIDYVFLQKNCQLVYEIILELANGDISLKK